MTSSSALLGVDEPIQIDHQWRRGEPASTTKRWLQVGRYDTANSEMDMNGGNLNLNANTDLRFATQGNAGTNIVNLNSGAITFYSDMRPPPVAWAWWTWNRVLEMPKTHST